MVFYFSTSEGYMIYMGKDKYENEDLIKYGIPEDLWYDAQFTTILMSLSSRCLKSNSIIVRATFGHSIHMFVSNNYCLT
jgi:hypothetical protein